jgi:hypothetical protein
LGKRSAEKTNFLNIIEDEAKKLNYCTVRINLDEGDSLTQYTFFYKLFDSIFTAVCDMGFFGGVNGKTYDVYTEIISGCFFYYRKSTKRYFNTFVELHSSYINWRLKL